MKKIGIITMHRVLNYGSSLQAYALYLKIKHIGYDCEIIDYQYPNEYHQNEKNKKTIKDRTLFFLLRVAFFILYRGRLQKKRFGDFFRKNIVLTRNYENREALYSNPPKCDIYMAGSDQVWNPNSMKGDSVFFCDFAGNNKKVSFASSFSVSSIPTEYEEIYKKNLASFAHIGVRESNGVTMVNSLVNKEATEVCDPTLLLTKNEYQALAGESEIKIKKPYILVYALSYAFKPYPALDSVVENIRKQTKMNVVYLHVNSIDHYHIGHSITSAGPNEFVRLFMDASFIVTSSFHGTAFAINFERPFYSIIPNEATDDSRIYSLLKKVGAETRCVMSSQKIDSDLSIEMDYKNVSERLSKYREESIAFLKKELSSE